jgi:hypothetical protein
MCITLLLFLSLLFVFLNFYFLAVLCNILTSRSQWPHGLRRGSVAARFLEFWFRIPPGAWFSVSCECCLLSGSGLCIELITLSEESHRVWCV